MIDKAAAARIEDALTARSFWINPANPQRTPTGSTPAAAGDVTVTRTSTTTTITIPTHHLDGLLELIERS